MNSFNVSLWISSTHQPGRTAFEGVEAGLSNSPHTWVSAYVLQAAGVQREKKISFVRDGHAVTRDVGFALISYPPSFRTVDEVVFAEPGDRLVLGDRTLKGFNAKVDPDQEELVAAGPILAAGNVK